MPAVRFSIVIPTRNRCETLIYTLQTCLTQVFADYEIVVSDNCSSDNTREVVEALNSPKIHYFRPDTPLSMSDSWEFAISKAVGEYIIVLGDDDGLLLHALRDLDLIIRELKIKVVRWNRVYYNWPNIAIQLVANQISIPLIWDSVFLDSSHILKDFDFQGDYTQLPMLYNSAIHRDLIEEVRRKAGRVFLSVLPDVSSGVAFACLSESYPSIGRPMSINGGSGKSNGVATMFVKDSPYANEFNRLNTQAQLGWHPAVPKILTFSTGLANTYLQVNERLCSRDLSTYIDRKKLITNCLNESRWKFDDEQAKQEVLEAIRKSINNDRELSQWFESYILDDNRLAWMPTKFVKRKGIADGMLHLDGGDFNVDNVYDVTVLYEKIMAHLDEPCKFVRPSAIEPNPVLSSPLNKETWIRRIKKFLIREQA